MTNTPYDPNVLKLDEDPDYLEDNPIFAEFQQNRVPPCIHEDEYAEIQATYEIFRDRNVLLCASDGSTVLAGVYQDGSISVNAFYRWMELLFAPSTGWYLRSYTTESIRQIHSPSPLSRDDFSPIEMGKYIAIDSEGTHVALTTLEFKYLHRIITVPTTPSNLAEYAFADGVLKRSPICAIKGSPYIYEFGLDEGTQISHVQIVSWVHIFPTGYADEWKISGLAADMQGYDPSQSPTKLLNSHQNGLALYADTCPDLNMNRIAVDVDDNYRVVRFDRYCRPLPPNARLEPGSVEGMYYPPPDSLLKAHFKQSLYRYVLGTGNLEYPDANRHALILHRGYARLDEECWTVGVGRAVFEAFFATKLFGCLPVFDTLDERNPRIKEVYRKNILDIHSPPEFEWPDSFETPLKIDDNSPNEYEAMVRPVTFPENTQEEHIDYWLGGGGPRPVDLPETPPGVVAWRNACKRFEESIVHREERED